jgi:hypothetical protein
VLSLSINSDSSITSKVRRQSRHAYLNQHNHHLNTVHQPSHQFPYIYHKHNQLVLILSFEIVIYRKGNAMSSATYGVIWMWLWWCWLIDLAVVRNAIHHQVVLEHRESFRK